MCVGNLTIIGSDNGLSPGWRQAINWTNAGVLLTGHLATKSKDILLLHVSIKKHAFENVVWEMSAILSRPQCIKRSKRNGISCPKCE